MAHIYTNKSSGQVVSSDEPIARLEGVARWVHTEGEAPQKVVEIPEGDPSEVWTVDQLKAYAEREGIDLADATKKADILSAVSE